jgi:hypothetical protein
MGHVNVVYCETSSVVRGASIAKSVIGLLENVELFELYNTKNILPCIYVKCSIHRHSKAPIRNFITSTSG